MFFVPRSVAAPPADSVHSTFVDSRVCRTVVSIVALLMMKRGRFRIGSPWKLRMFAVVVRNSERAAARLAVEKAVAATPPCPSFASAK